jgi:hypothetical protein
MPFSTQEPPQARPDQTKQTTTEEMVPAPQEGVVLDHHPGTAGSAVRTALNTRRPASVTPIESHQLSKAVAQTATKDGSSRNLQPWRCSSRP